MGHTNSGREFLIPEDIIYSSKLVIPHKIKLSAEAVINSVSEKKAVQSVISNIEIPVGTF